jgi:hypothetical protein
MSGLTIHPRSSRLWFRMVVPERHRGRVGKREIVFSLGTSDPVAAQALHAAEKTKWRKVFSDFDRERDADDCARAPKLVADTMAALAESNTLDDVVVALCKFISFRVVTSWGPEFYAASEAAHAFGGQPDAATWDDDVEIDVIPPVDRAGVVATIETLERTARTQGMGHRRIVARILERRRWDLVEPEILLVESTANITIVKGSVLYEAVAEALLTALIEHRSKAWDDAALAAFPPAAIRSPELTAPALEAAPLPPSRGSPLRLPEETNDRARSPLSGGLVHWRMMQKPRPQSDREVTRAVERFIALIGDLPVGEMTNRNILDYRDLIARMPKNLQLPNLSAAGRTLREAIQEAPEGGTRLSPGSIKKDIGGLQAVLALLVDERWVPANVALGIRVAGYAKRKQGSPADRQPLTREMMVTLFASPMFTGCIGQGVAKRSRPGSFVYQDALYWIPLLEATSGARLEELGQTLLVDIRIADLALGTHRKKPFWRTVSDITDAGPDQHVKTEASKRLLFIHPWLVALGFNDYVARRRAEGATRLFDLTWSINEKWTKELSRKLNRYIDATVTKDARYVFYSLRHEWKDRADNSGIDPKFADMISGSAPLTVGHKYGKGASPLKLATELDKLDVSLIDWHRLMTAAGR